MKNRGWNTENALGYRREKVAAEAEYGDKLKMASSSHASSHHCRDDHSVVVPGSARSTASEADGSGHNAAFQVKTEPETDPSGHLASWHSQVLNPSFWTPVSSDESLDLRRGDLKKYQKPGKRGHSGRKSLAHSAPDPLGCFRNPSWHDTNAPEQQDRQALDNSNVQIVDNMLAEGNTSDRSSDKKLLSGRGAKKRKQSKHKVGRKSNKKNKETSRSQVLEPGELRWPSDESDNGGVGDERNEEEEEEELFHPPVHFDAHQQQQEQEEERTRDPQQQQEQEEEEERTMDPQQQQQCQFPGWEEEEEERELGEIGLCDDDGLSSFPMSTFRARLDETKCHKRKASTASSAVVPSGLPEHVCAHCGHCFVDASNLRRHISFSHPDKKEKRVRKVFKRSRKCDECGKTFDRPSRLERHKTIHSDARPFVCHICEKTFSRKSNLNIHLHLHTGKKNFVCEVCDKAFSDNGKLKKHQVIHTGDKPFVCDICHKGFAESGNLKRHKKYHLGHKAFACEVCGKAFIESGMLRRHKVQTNHNPIICFICNRSFLLPEHLEAHTAKEHGLSSGDGEGGE